MTLISCRKKSLSHDELVKYIHHADNGLVKEEEVGEIKFKMTYRPTDLIVWQEVKGKELSDSLIKAKRDNYNKYYYFILNISSAGQDVLNASGSFQKFSDNLSALSFHMPEYTYAVADSKDTLYLADFYVPRFYGLSKSTEVLLAFERKGKAEEEIVIRLNDFGIGAGTTRYRFKTSDLNNVPELKF